MKTFYYYILFLVIYNHLEFEAEFKRFLVIACVSSSAYIRILGILLSLYLASLKSSSSSSLAAPDDDVGGGGDGVRTLDLSIMINNTKQSLW